jgi:hypothetical protein
MKTLPKQKVREMTSFLEITSTAKRLAREEDEEDSPLLAPM